MNYSKVSRYLAIVAIVVSLMFGFLLNQYITVTNNFISNINSDVIENTDGLNNLELKSTTSIKTLSNKLKSINKEITKLKIVEEPSYRYLCSITVQIEGVGQIEQDGEKKRIAWGGTGVVVKVDEEYTYILTNAHVSGRNREPVMLYVTDKNKRREALLVKRHEYLDLALIKVPGKLEGKRAVAGYANVDISEKIFLVGHHLGRPYVYGRGFFAGYQGIYGIIQIPTMFGNSGSGVINKNGELVALVFAINRVGFGYDCSHGLVIDSFSIKYFLQKQGIIE